MAMFDRFYVRPKSLNKFNRKIEKPVDSYNMDVTHLYTSRELSDVTFVFGADSLEPVSVHAHKLVLAAQSPVFRAMLFGDLKQEDKKVAVSFSLRTSFDVRFKGVSLFLRSRHDPNLIIAQFRFASTTSPPTPLSCF